MLSMAKPAISIVDHTDEDFFDKLVDDEVISGTVVRNGVNSSVNGFDTHLDALNGPRSVQSGEDDIVSCKLDSQVENIDAEGVLESMEQNNATEFNGHVENGESGFDSMIGGNDVDTGGGVKQVQWSAFSGAVRQASYSDFFNGVVDELGDSFGVEAGEFTIASDTTTGISCNNQGVYSSSSSFDQNECNLQHRSSTQKTAYVLQHGSSTQKTAYGLQHGSPTQQTGYDLQHGSPTQQTACELQHGSPTQKTAYGSQHGSPTQQSAYGLQNGSPTQQTAYGLQHGSPTQKTAYGLHHGSPTQQTAYGLQNGLPMQQTAYGLQNGSHTQQTAYGLQNGSHTQQTAYGLQNGSPAQQTAYGLQHGSPLQQTVYGLQNGSPMQKTAFGLQNGSPAQKTAYGLSHGSPTQQTAYGLQYGSPTQKTANGLQHGSPTQQTAYGLQHGSPAKMQDQSNSQYWESLYPDWRYDPNARRWHQLNGPDSAGAQSTGKISAMDSISDVYYLQQTAQSISGTMNQASTANTLSYWNQILPGNTQYPENMVFDSQYPGWYYDTIAQEWKSLDSYAPSINQSVGLEYNQQLPIASATDNYYSNQTMTNGQPRQINWGASVNNYQQQDMSKTRLAQFGKNKVVGSTQNTQFGNGFLSMDQTGYLENQKIDVTASEKSSLYEQRSQGFSNGNGFSGFQGFNGVTGFQNYVAPLQQTNQHNMEFDQQFSAAYINGPKVHNYSQQPLQKSIQPCASSEGRSSSGRPPHALVTFGFGGKLIVMKDQSNLHTQPGYAGQDSAGVTIDVLNMMEVTVLKNDGPNAGLSTCDYFSSLCQQSLPGPLVSGNVGAKELNKWIDDRIANCARQVVDYKKGEALKMLFSLLKIACRFYGKLQSSFGTDFMLKENDSPESALATLFSSAKRNRAQFSAINHYLQSMPSKGQIQATADEVQMLLVSGRRMEALQRAQEGQLWGPAIVIAAFLGEQLYGEIVKKMAVDQLVAGSPLRTLCLLLAGKPAEVFSNYTTNSPRGVNVSQSAQVVPSCMLDQWEDNLAIITANRTKGDELVITHLGDCLWKERGEVTTAHICYLVAGANIESYSDSARLCLVGVDHLKCPRTYASPDAIQRTELYEYAKVLGNSQFILLPFQPYKLFYACMLAEVGKLSDSLKYCQAILKLLKAGRSSEVDAWRHMVSSLEERIKIHQQGGYAINLAPKKLVGKLLTFFDNTAHMVVGGLPPPIPSPTHDNGPPPIPSPTHDNGLPPIPSPTHDNGQHIDHDHQSKAPQMSTSQSTETMSSLIPQAESAPPEESSCKSFHNRSISEPEICRRSSKDESPKKTDTCDVHDNSSATGGTSRFGRLGAQIFQKTIGLVLRSRPDKQAKLGETNKFYYDKKLKRWVEEGADPPSEEPALAPPPTMGAFTKGEQDNDKKDESTNNTIHANGKPELRKTNSFEKKSVTPPIPSGANQFSACMRIGVRARYVDTFNKGGGAQANLFQSTSPSVQTKPAAIGNGKFFVPAPITSQETDTTQNAEEATHTHTDEDTTTYTSNHNHSLSSPKTLTPPLTPPPLIPRHQSMEGLPDKRSVGVVTNGNGHLPRSSLSRRTSSWSGGFGEVDTTKSRSSFPPPSTFTSFSSTLSQDLQEVQL